MAKTNFAPWSAETAQGIKTDPVDSNIKVRQEVVPAITVGTVNALTGEWTGVTESDTAFLIDPTHEAIANGASVLSPQSANQQYIDMTNYNDIFIAVLPSASGNIAIEAVMGPSTSPFANLTPVNAAAALRGCVPANAATPDMDLLFSDGAEALTGDVWNIYAIQGQLAGQKNLQFKLTNNMGGIRNLQFAYLRVV